MFNLLSVEFKQRDVFLNFSKMDEYKIFSETQIKASTNLRFFHEKKGDFSLAFDRAKGDFSSGMDEISFKIEGLSSVSGQNCKKFKFFKRRERLFCSNRFFSSW